jgi:hypothetical protein
VLTGDGRDTPDVRRTQSDGRALRTCGIRHPDAIRPQSLSELPRPQSVISRAMLHPERKKTPSVLPGVSLRGVGCGVYVDPIEPRGKEGLRPGLDFAWTERRLSSNMT